MKKTLLFVAFAIFGLMSAQAQSNTGQTKEGNWLIEVNTGFGPEIGINGLDIGKVATTGISFRTMEDFTKYSFGGEVGYFIMDDFAIKAGVGYTGVSAAGSTMSSLSYKIGAKYYIIGNVPVQIDFTGAKIKDTPENPSYFGLQAGYAIFLGDHISLEPGIRYNLSLNEDFSDEGMFGLNIGFAAYF